MEEKQDCCLQKQQKVRKPANPVNGAPSVRGSREAHVALKQAAKSSRVLSGMGSATIVAWDVRLDHSGPHCLPVEQDNNAPTSKIVMST